MDGIRGIEERMYVFSMSIFNAEIINFRIFSDGRFYSQFDSYLPYMEYPFARFFSCCQLE